MATLCPVSVGSASPRPGRPASASITTGSSTWPLSSCPLTAREPASEPALQVGDRVGPLAFLCHRPEDLVGGWPCRLYDLRELVGLRRDAEELGLRNGQRVLDVHDPFGRREGSRGRATPGWLVADEATITAELPGWRYFGPHAEGVPGVLDAIWRLDPARIATLTVPEGSTSKGEQIPIPLLPASPGLERGASNAFSACWTFFESRSWTVGEGGSVYYRGCYFTYIVTEPHWLVAMGLAHNALMAHVAGPTLKPDTRRQVLTAWAYLAE